MEVNVENLNDSTHCPECGSVFYIDHVCEACQFQAMAKTPTRLEDLMDRYYSQQDLSLKAYKIALIRRSEFLADYLIQLDELKESSEKLWLIELEECVCELNKLGEKLQFKSEFKQTDHAHLIFQWSEQTIIPHRAQTSSMIHWSKIIRPIAIISFFLFVGFVYFLVFLN